MEGKHENLEVVWSSVKFWARNVAKKIEKVKKLSKGDMEVLKRMDVKIVEKYRRRPRIVRLSMPSPGRFKLNVNGSSIGNPGKSGGGGVLRDDIGKLVFAFSKYFGYCSNNVVELRVVLERLSLCKQLGFSKIDIECDSLVVANWIVDKKCIVWYLWDFWDKLVVLLEEFDFSINHCFREANSVANLLAKYGAQRVNKVFRNVGLLDIEIRGLYRLDKSGMAYIRG